MLVCACAVGVATCFAAPVGGESRSACSAPPALSLFFFSFPWLGWTRVCGQRLHKEDKSVLRCVLCLLWWMNTSLGCVRRHYELSCGVKCKYLLPPKGASVEMENSATKYIQFWIISKREYVRIYLLLFEISHQSLYPANWLSTIFLINYIPHCESECLPSFPLEDIKIFLKSWSLSLDPGLSLESSVCSDGLHMNQYLAQLHWRHQRTWVLKHKYFPYKNCLRALASSHFFFFKLHN